MTQQISNSGAPDSKLLIDTAMIHKQVISLASRINQDYSGLEIDLVCLSNSAVMFTADLVRLIKVPVRQHIIAFNTYAEASDSGEVSITLDVQEPLYGRHVLLLEGMIISGRTPLYIMNMLQNRRPASLNICSIGIKPKQLAVDLTVKYSLFTFEKEWVVGYGIGDGLEKTDSNLWDFKQI